MKRHVDEELEDEELDLEELEDDDEDVEEIEITGKESSGLLGFAAGLLVGLIVGAGVAILAAPERGDVVRRRIRRSVQDFGDDARHRIDDLTDQAGHEFTRHRRRLQRRLKRR